MRSAPLLTVLAPAIAVLPVLPVSARQLAVQPATAPVAAAPATVAATPGLSAATAPACASRPSAATRIELPIDGQVKPGEYWLWTPPGYAPDQLPSLVIALHGTDDTARQMIDFWASLKPAVPVLLAAPQGQGKGWSEADLPIIRAMWADLAARYGFDHQRVLLAGFSAGGAMTFELLYGENFPATAAAALANYVPPWITLDEIAARRDVPVFYAVGMADLNHERMRTGLDYLRSAGATVELYRPRIGHTLDAQVARKALDWFVEQSRRRLEAAIDQAAKDENPAAAVALLESITTQPRWHEAAVVQKATWALEAREERGRSELRAADALVTAGRQVEAAELLRTIEATYGQGRLGREAGIRREQLERNEAIRDELALRQARRRADQATALYRAAQRFVVQQKHAEAAACCRRIINEFGETAIAQRATLLLEIIQTENKP